MHIIINFIWLFQEQASTKKGETKDGMNGVNGREGQHSNRKKREEGEEAHPVVRVMMKKLLSDRKGPRGGQNRTWPAAPLRRRSAKNWHAAKALAPPLLPWGSQAPPQQQQQLLAW